MLLGSQMSLAVAEDWPKQRSDPTRPATCLTGLTNRAYLVGAQPTSVYPRLGAEWVGTNLRRLRPSIWKSPVVPIGQRAFQVLGRRGPFCRRPQQWTIENKG